MLWLAPHGSYDNRETPSINNHWETLVTVYYSQDLEITLHTQGHTTRSWVERKIYVCMGLVFCFYWE